MVDLPNFVSSDKRLEQYLNLLIRKIRRAIATYTAIPDAVNGGGILLPDGTPLRVIGDNSVGNWTDNNACVGIVDKPGGVAAGRRCPIASTGTHECLMVAALAPSAGDFLVLKSGNTAFSNLWTGGSDIICGVIVDASMYSTVSPTNLYCVAILGLPAYPPPAV